MQSVLVDGHEAEEEEAFAADEEPLETDDATGLEAMFAQVRERQKISESECFLVTYYHSTSTPNKQ